MTHQKMERGTKTTYPRPDYHAELTDQQAIAAELVDFDSNPTETEEYRKWHPESYDYGSGRLAHESKPDDPHTPLPDSLPVA